MSFYSRLVPQWWGPKSCPTAMSVQVLPLGRLRRGNISVVRLTLFSMIIFSGGEVVGKKLQTNSHYLSPQEYARPHSHFDDPRVMCQFHTQVTHCQAPCKSSSQHTDQNMISFVVTIARSKNTSVCHNEDPAPTIRLLRMRHRTRSRHHYGRMMCCSARIEVHAWPEKPLYTTRFS